MESSRDKILRWSLIFLSSSKGDEIVNQNSQISHILKISTKISGDIDGSLV
jgi:hypothetical protein